MQKEYFCRAYRYQLYSALCIIKAETQAEALRKLKQKEKNGELNFDGLCEDLPVNELVVEPVGDADELTVTFSENCLYSLRYINQTLTNALQIAEAFMSGFEDDQQQEGIAENLAAIRNALAEAKS